LLPVNCEPPTAAATVDDADATITGSRHEPRIRMRSGRHRGRLRAVQPRAALTDAFSDQQVGAKGEREPRELTNSM